MTTKLIGSVMGLMGACLISMPTFAETKDLLSCPPLKELGVAQGDKVMLQVKGNSFKSGYSWKMRPVAVSETSDSGVGVIVLTLKAADRAATAVRSTRLNGDLVCFYKLMNDDNGKETELAIEVFPQDATGHAM